MGFEPKLEILPPAQARRLACWHMGLCFTVAPPLRCASVTGARKILISFPPTHLKPPRCWLHCRFPARPWSCKAAMHTLTLRI